MQGVIDSSVTPCAQKRPNRGYTHTALRQTTTCSAIPFTIHSSRIEVLYGAKLWLMKRFLKLSTNEFYTADYIRKLKVFLYGLFSVIYISYECHLLEMIG